MYVINYFSSLYWVLQNQCESSGKLLHQKKNILNITKSPTVPKINMRIYPHLQEVSQVANRISNVCWTNIGVWHIDQMLDTTVLSLANKNKSVFYTSDTLKIENRFTGYKMGQHFQVQAIFKLLYDWSRNVWKLHIMCSVSDGVLIASKRGNCVTNYQEQWQMTASVA